MSNSRQSYRLSRLSLGLAAVLVGAAAVTVFLRTSGEKALADEISNFRGSASKGQLSFMIDPASAGGGVPPVLAVHSGSHSPLFRVDCRREKDELIPVPAVRQNGAKWRYMSAGHPLRLHASRAAELVDCNSLADRRSTS